MKWTKEDLLRLDIKYANEGLPLHQRPLRAAAELLKAAALVKGEFIIEIIGNPEVQSVIDAYSELIPDVNTTWPGMGIGLAVSVDQIRKLTLGVAFGSPSIQPWQMGCFQSETKWWEWCRKNEDITSQATFAYADLHDFAHGFSEISHKNTDAKELWYMALSNLGDVANTLPSTFSVDSVIQPICLIAELAIKGTLVFSGVAKNSLKGPGHNIELLAQRMAKTYPHRDDPLVEQVVSKLPPYVASRYSPAGLTRLKVARLALGVQFIGASALRRIANTDLAAMMEASEWPAPRRPFFP